jgi:hypothetical protein
VKITLFRRAQSSSLLILVVVVTAAGFMSTFPRNASALQITTRSLTLEADTVGGSAPGDGNPAHTVKHQFTFTIPSSSNLGSIQFLYCTDPNPANACTTPTGLVTTAATLSSQSGANTGFSLNNTTNGSPYLTRVAAPGVTASSSTYELSDIQNPDNTICFGGTTPQSNNCTFYVRISTFATTDTTGGSTDTGTVAASTSTQIDLSGYMPESLVFCTGGTIGVNGGGAPDCATATSGTIAFPDFDPQATSYTTSQMAASTNAGGGYIITVNGATLTSGSNTISAMGTAGLSLLGTGQFGMNLVFNDEFCGTACDLGADVSPVANGTNYRGQAVAGYNTGGDDSVANFKFTSGDTVADSANGGAGGTDGQIFTVSYIVNVPGSQPAGTYTTTLTYICTPTF